MKKILLLILIPAIQLAQPSVNVWRITPIDICPDDSIKVDFKLTGYNQIVNFVIKSPTTYTVGWTGNINALYNCPKEHYPQLAPGDSCYYKWFFISYCLCTYSGLFCF